MGSITDFLEGELLDHVFNIVYGKPTTVYLGLSTSTIDDTGNDTEPVGNGYVRKAITFDAAAARLLNQTATVTFDEASGAWGTITDYGIYDAETNGNLMAYGVLSAAKAIVSGNTASIAAGQIDISFKTLGAKGDGTNNISDYLANTLLDLAFRNQAYASPATYIGYCTADVVDADAGADITEVTDANNYSRKQVNINGGASPTWDLAASQLVDNTHDIVQAAPSGSWGLITALVIMDSATHGAGEVLFYDNGIVEQTPTSGDTVKNTAGSLDISLT